MKFHSGYIPHTINNGKNIFVFGSNEKGIHGKGSALVARKHWGAIYGQGKGLQGQSYAIPTKDEKLKSRSLAEIKDDVYYFINHAQWEWQFNYFVVRIGCQLAGFKDGEIAPMFKTASDNVFLPDVWKEILFPTIHAYDLTIHLS